MSGPTWLPPKQPEPPRAPQGRALPRGALGPPPAHGASKCFPLARPGAAEEPLATRRRLPSPSARFLRSPPQARGPCPCATFPGSCPFPDAPGEKRSLPTAVLSLTALQPHPRGSFCPLPPEQCYQPPGVADDRGPTWVGSLGAPQRLQVRVGGEVKDVRVSFSG